MTAREKILLLLLERASQPLTRTALVKLVFLLRHETSLKHMPSFYDFLPYRFGPFSYVLYREINRLSQDRYISIANERISIEESRLRRSDESRNFLPAATVAAIDYVLQNFGKMNQQSLIEYVYETHSWYAVNSTLNERRLASARLPEHVAVSAYTIGYEGRSIDAFMNYIIQRGIKVLVDIRNRPVSRKYGFSKLRLNEICMKLNINYSHFGELGVPSKYRSQLTDDESYRRLFTYYRESILPLNRDDVEQVGRLMCSTPSVLVCFERDPTCCHRSALAETVATNTGLKVVHL